MVIEYLRKVTLKVNTGFIVQIRNYHFLFDCFQSHLCWARSKSVCWKIPRQFRQLVSGSRAYRVVHVGAFCDRHQLISSRLLTLSTVTGLSDAFTSSCKKSSFAQIKATLKKPRHLSMFLSANECLVVEKHSIKTRRRLCCVISYQAFRS